MASGSSIWSPEIILRRLCMEPPTEDEEHWSAEGRKIIDLLDGTFGSDAATLNNVYNIVEIRVQEEATYRQEADANLQAQLTGNVPLEASAFSPISWHKQVIENSVDIPDDVNAWSFGPTMTIAHGQAVTIGNNSFWTIASGEQQL